MILYQVIEFLATWLECMIGMLIVTGLVTDMEIEWRKSSIAAVIISLVVLGCNQVRLLLLVATVVGVTGIAFGVKVIIKWILRIVLFFRLFI